MKYKVDPSQKEWIGEGGYPGRPGFVILKSKPRFPPVEIAAKCGPASEYVKQLSNPALKHACVVEGKGQNLEWILRCAQTSTIGTLGRVDELDMLPRQPENRANFGTLERVGLRSHNMDLQIIRKSEYHGIIEEFWRLPEGAGRAPDAVTNADERNPNAGLVPDSQNKTRERQTHNSLPTGGR